MGVHRLNHAVLYVRDAAVSARFYEGMLGFVAVHTLPNAEDPQAVFMQAPDSTNDHDLGLFTIGPAADTVRRPADRVGLYHLAWEVDTLSDLSEIAQRLTAADALVGATDHGATKALYAQDPDGIDFEVCWLVPAEHLDPDSGMRMLPLDLEAAITRYGADTPGGIGVSRPVRQ